MSLNTLSQFGLPAIVRVFRPVIRSLLDCNGFMDWGILDMSWHDLRRYDKDWHDLLIPDIRTDMIWEEVIWNLLVQELERKLKPNCLHVGLLQGGGDVHVHVEEPAFQIGDICFDKDILLVSYFHCPSSLPLSLLSLSSLLSSFSPFHRPSLFCLLDLQLREQRDKPDDKILLLLRSQWFWLWSSTRFNISRKSFTIQSCAVLCWSRRSQLSASSSPLYQSRFKPFSRGDKIPPSDCHQIGGSGEIQMSREVDKTAAPGWRGRLSICRSTSDKCSSPPSICKKYWSISISSSASATRFNDW